MTETGTPGDVHIWKPGTSPAEAECGYVQETIEHEADEEKGSEAWTEVVPVEHTGNVCTACQTAVAPVEESDEDEGEDDGNDA